ncbi:hypothetical protein [Rossellomorea sp. BNER]|jgi:hypothetical protein
MWTKKPFILIIITCLVIAGLIDLKFKGLLFQMLPTSIQAFIA